MFSYKKNQNKNSFVRKSVVLLSVILTIGIFVYVLQISSIIFQHFQINNLKEKLASAWDANRKLTLEVSKADSITELAKVKDLLNMVEVDKVSYIKAGSSEVTMAK